MVIFLIKELQKLQLATQPKELGSKGRGIWATNYILYVHSFETGFCRPLFRLNFGNFGCDLNFYFQLQVAFYLLVSVYLCQDYPYCSYIGIAHFIRKGPRQNILWSPDGLCALTLLVVRAFSIDNHNLFGLLTHTMIHMKVRLHCYIHDSLTDIGIYFDTGKYNFYQNPFQEIFQNKCLSSTLCFIWLLAM